MTKMKLTLLTAAAALIATPALAADFGELDANTDGQLTFDEYSVHATAQGKTVTLAAQEFTKMSQGDAIVTADEMLLAEVMADSSAQSATLAPAPLVMPLETAPVETIEPAPLMGETTFEPPVVETDDMSDEVVDDRLEETEPVEAPGLIINEMPVETPVAPTDADIEMESETEVEMLESDDIVGDTETESDLDETDDDTQPEE